MNNKDYKPDDFVVYVLFFILGFAICYALKFLIDIDYNKINESGQVGDLIGGLSAPIIGSIGALLVYKSFKAQVEANQNQFNELKIDRKRLEDSATFDRIKSLLEDINNDLGNFSYFPQDRYSESDKLLYGYYALAEFNEQLNIDIVNLTNVQGVKRTLNNLKNLLITINFTSHQIIEFESRDLLSKQILRIKFQNTFSDYYEILEYLYETFVLINSKRIEYPFVKDLDQIERLLNVVNGNYLKITSP